MKIAENFLTIFEFLVNLFMYCQEKIYFYIIIFKKRRFGKIFNNLWISCFSEYYRLFHEHHEQVHVYELQNSVCMQICLLSHEIYDLSFITVDTFWNIYGLSFELNLFKYYKSKVFFSKSIRNKFIFRIYLNF